MNSDIEASFEAHPGRAGLLLDRLDQRLRIGLGLERATNSAQVRRVARTERSA